MFQISQLGTDVQCRIETLEFFWGFSYFVILNIIKIIIMYNFIMSQLSMEAP
jgi:hypothetical protein